MCYLNEQVIFFTGSRQQGYEKKVECYDMKKLSMRELKDMNHPRCRHSSIGFRSQYVFVFGGFHTEKDQNGKDL